MILIKGFKFLLLFITLSFQALSALEVSELFPVTGPNGDILPRGDENYQYIKLDVPVYLYTEKYDLVYINTNGLLTFRSEFPFFVNVPFPLELPAIAPFYSNVDTSLNNDSAIIAYYQSHYPKDLERAEQLVRQSYADAHDFQAESLFVATWQDVGSFHQKNTVTNTFQTVLVLAQEETYVIFLYPRGGLNWIQGDTGDSGLPDIRAQAGFVSEDHRKTLLKGSGTDNVRHLTESTNVDQPGVWLYRVGQLGYDDNVGEPDLYRPLDQEPSSCASGGQYRCHSNAVCQDTVSGFCCSCKNGYYGDGQTCIRSDVPLRVSGTLKGSVGNESVDTQIQSYVVMAEGRTYTAISPLSESIGSKLQLAQVIGGTIGWLFARPVGDVKNGFQITGGKFSSIGTLRFEETNEVFQVNQKYSGLNLWDQLSAEVEISGDLPEVPAGVRLSLSDFVEEFTRTNNKISTVSRHTIRISSEEREIPFTLYQEITFEPCKYSDSGDSSEEAKPVGILKSTRISIHYDTREHAVRLGAVNKIGTSTNLNPCDDGTHNCGDNTQCVPNEDDTFECHCLDGFTYSPYGDHGITNCVDIDECSSDYNTCSRDARCINEPGSFRCVCNPGYDGNGYQCDPIRTRPERPRPPQSQPPPSPSYPTTYPTQYPPQYPEQISKEVDPRFDQHCQYCSPYAKCEQGRCKCNFGYSGDGQECQYNCPTGQIWNIDRCEDLSQPEDYETQPRCTVLGCDCPDGYMLIETGTKEICQLEDSDASESQGDTSCDIENNCSAYATCQWNDQIGRYECICNPGFHGDGIDCREKEVSCVEEDICDEHAVCLYNEKLRKSTCVCDPGYEGDGKVCHLEPECSTDDNCGHNSFCDDGLCQCNTGFERDISDFCVPAGSCGGAYCAENAICQWDPNQKVSYCHCPAGFDGDGVRQCKSVPPPCNIRNNCGLYASCVPSQSGDYQCVCDPGYDGNGFVCNLERNCRNFADICDPNANCEYIGSSYRCVCKTGFLGNGTSCSDVPKVENGFLFISQGAALVRVPLNGRIGSPVASAHMAIGVAKDCAAGRIYWSDITEKSIKSVAYDGKDIKVFINEGIVSPEGLAIDWISRRIYWADSGKDTIEVASLDDPIKRAVLINKNLVNPRGIAVDPIQEKLYWSDWDRKGPKVEVSNLDGSGRQQLVGAPDVQLPNSLVISPNTREVCYADAGTKKIECIDTYSRVPNTIASNLSYPFGLATTDEHFYWTDWTTKKIEIIDLYGNRQQALKSPLFGSHKMYGAVAITDKCPLHHSPCGIDNGGCPVDRICLLNRQSPSGISCKCIDNKECNEALLPEFIFSK